MYFEIFKSDSNSQYYFHIKSSNHKIVAQSEGYTSKSSAMNTIDSIKKNISTDTEVNDLT